MLWSGVIIVRQLCMRYNMLLLLLLHRAFFCPHIHLSAAIKMFFKAGTLAGLVALAAAAPAPAVTQITDGQVQASSAAVAVTQITDGQIQASSAAAPVTQISDGQVQASSAAVPVSQISDGQVQATASVPGTTSGITNPTATAGHSVSFSALPYTYNQALVTDLSAASAAASRAGLPITEIPGATDALPPIISAQVTGVTSHGPYSGPAPTITGAIANKAAGTAIPFLPPNPTALVYNPNGQLNNQEPVPYQPAGGLGTVGHPVHVLKGHC